MSALQQPEHFSSIIKLSPYSLLHRLQVRHFSGEAYISVVDYHSGCLMSMDAIKLRPQSLHSGFTDLLRNCVTGLVYVVRDRFTHKTVYFDSIRHYCRVQDISSISSRNCPLLHLGQKTSLMFPNFSSISSRPHPGHLTSLSALLPFAWRQRLQMSLKTRISRLLFS